MVLHQRGAIAEAAARYTKVLEGDPRNARALFLLGVARGQEGRFAESAELLRKAVRAAPKHAPAHHHLGLALRALGKPEAALRSFSQALQHQPDLVEAGLDRAALLARLGRRNEALQAYDRILALAPRSADGWCERGLVLEALGRHAEAIASYDRAVALDSTHAAAHANRGNALAQLDRHEEAIASFAAAIAARPDFAEAYVNRGNSLRALGRDEESLASHEQAVKIRPEIGVLGAVLTARLARCEWQSVSELEQAAHRLVGRDIAVEPSVLVTCSGDLPTLCEAARSFARANLPSARTPAWNRARLSGAKIRVAYLSADFHRHATAYLIAELIELHDRDRFEILGVSWGPDDASDTRKRLAGAFDAFLDVSTRSNEEITALLRERGIDIAVDLKGYTENSRPGIFAARAAPVQVSYLGYPGTLGADFMDYLIGDALVTPSADQPFYAERIVQLPGSYQVNDRKRPVGETSPGREEVGLPPRGFVFCCFNNLYKIREPVFDVWMRLLRQVDGSVLWLLHANDAARRNLAHQAEKRGVDPSRLVFAPRVDIADHLARHRLADLFLDTLPYNAHTTASDALWAGLPVLTCSGTAFAGRVGASLLHAAGLPELVTRSLDDYEALALRLAREPEILRSLRDRLARGRLACALFDTETFGRNIETAYDVMWRRWLRGLPPEGFAVKAPGIAMALDGETPLRNS